MYGHQFYHASIQEKVKFLNQQLDKRSLNCLCEENFLDSEDLKMEMRREGYYFFHELNRFIFISDLDYEPNIDYLVRKVIENEPS